ncbi:hypothetical protein LO762_25380 [Actinocorallia sp. API 0066]|uniref:hypothetical protein n=1 Tax=Actinocorallia sp. API 0066 TaxID=2896846 RepID=UPI001E5D4548|nr:hypothetical protein [Actinocorallia sp. API 0066]MCD0452491.1 hypothetical protein [Actinocorallia sp. API 0066]
MERSTRLCPHLRGGHVVLRARRVVPAAISGMLYKPTRDGLAPAAATIAHDDPRIRWLRAAQLHMELGDYDVIHHGHMIITGSGWRGTMGDRQGRP